MRWDRPSPVQSAPTPMAGVPAQRRTVAAPEPADAPPGAAPAAPSAQAAPAAPTGAVRAADPLPAPQPGVLIAPPVVARAFSHPASPDRAGRAESDIVAQAVAGPMDLARRIGALLMLSPWAMLTIIIWWAWRVVMLLALGVEPTTHPRALAWGLFCDAAIIFGAFAGVRSAVLSRSSELDVRTAWGRTVLSVASVLLGLLVLLRMADIVHCAVERMPIGVAFWSQLLDAPGMWLTSGAAVATALAATAIAVLTWFALAGDLEVVRHAAEPLPVTATFASVHGCAIVALAVAVAVSAEAAVAPLTPRDAGRLPEVHALLALQEALALRARAAPARLDM